MTLQCNIQAKYAPCTYLERVYAGKFRYISYKALYRALAVKTPSALDKYRGFYPPSVRDLKKEVAEYLKIAADDIREG